MKIGKFPSFWYNKHSLLWIWEVFGWLIESLNTKCLFSKGFIRRSRPYLFNTNWTVRGKLSLFFFFYVTSIFTNVPLDKTTFYTDYINRMLSNMKKSIFKNWWKIYAQKPPFHLMVKFINKLMVCWWFCH